MNRRRFSTTATTIAALSAAVCLAFPALAAAQQEPYPQQQQPYPQQQQPYPQQEPYPQQPQQQPSYALPAPSYAYRNAIKGVVNGFDGQWVLYMRDEKGYNDHISLRQGTIINPTGIRLIEGMSVAVFGHADGSTYQADRIDVVQSPYSPYYGYGGNPYGYGGSPYGGGYYAYGGAYPYGYGYPGYGYPGYGYGWPWFGAGVNWGWGWGWGWRGAGWHGGGCCWGGWRGGGGGGRPINGGTIHGTVQGRPPR